MSKSEARTSAAQKRRSLIQGSVVVVVLALTVAGIVVYAPPSPRSGSQPPGPTAAATNTEASLRAAIESSHQDRLPRLRYLEFLLDGKRTLDALDVCRDAVRVLPHDPAIRSALADSFEGAGRIPEAIKSLTSSSPAETGLRLQLARLLVRDGQPRKAVEIVQGVGNPSHEQALTAALILVDARQPQEAVRVLRPFVEAGLGGELLNSYGFALLQSGKYAEAATVLQQILSQSSPVPALHYYTGCALRLSGKPKQLPTAVAELQAATAQVATDALFQYELARCLMRQNDWPGAEAALEQAAAAGAAFPEIQRDLSQVSAKCGHLIPAAIARARYLQDVDDAPAAVRVLLPLLKNHPEDARLELALPVAMFGAGQLPEATAALKKFRARKPKDTDLIWSQYHFHTELKQYPQALIAADALVTELGETPAVLKERAATLQRLTRYQEAEELLTKLRDLEPLNPTHHYNLGVALSLWSTRADAKQVSEIELRKALELRPEYPEALYALGQLLQGQRRASEAAPYLRRALDFAPLNQDGLRLLGRTYLQLGDKERSADLFQVFRAVSARAAERSRLELPVQLFRDLHRSRMALVRFHLRTGDLVAATRELEIVIHHFPEDVEAHQLLAPLYGHGRRFQRQSEELEWLKAHGRGTDSRMTQ